MEFKKINQAEEDICVVPYGSAETAGNNNTCSLDW